MTATLGALVRSVAARVGSTMQARWIVAHAAGLDEATLGAHLDRAVPPPVQRAVQEMVGRLHEGEPLQYVLGRWAFRGLEVDVDSRALVPRPETEQVVTFALDELARIVGRGAPPSGRVLVAADLGTGTGVIALSLALEGPPDLEVWATDRSGPALELFDVNARAATSRHPGLAGRVHGAQGCWFDALDGTLAGGIDVVVSNPPYVSAAEWELLDPVVRDHEPREALVPGPSGLEALEELVRAAPRWLAPGGALVLELAPHQAATVAAMAGTVGFEAVAIRPDLSGRDRAVVARWPGA